jgi:DNA-binding response OmpR family regulator
MGKKVLFINKLSPASIIPEILAGAGYEVDEAFDGDAALHRLDSQHHDLVILMENANAESWMLCARLRRLSNSPVMVISSGASAESCVRAIDAGADFFLRKSFGPMELLARVNALFQRVSTQQPVPVNQ